MRRRLVGAIAGVAAGAIILFGIPLGLVLQRSYRDEELVRLQRDAVAATRNIGTSIPRDHPELPAFSGQVGIYSGSAVRIVGAGPVRGDATVRSAIRSRAPEGAAPGGQLIVAVPLYNGELITGALRARRTQAEVAARTRTAWLEIAGIGLGVLALATAAGLALARRLVAPLDALASVARRVGAGDFGARASRSALPEVDALGAALNAGSRQVSELVTREREFSANASHQLRTPLAALRLELEATMLSAGQSRPELTAALAQVERLEVTIETLLSLARAPRPAGTAAVDLGIAVSELRTRWHGRLAAAGRPLRISLETRPAVGRMPPAVLDEIVDILIQNAYDHGRGAVTVTVREAGDTLAVEVSDQGGGFAADPETLFARGVGSGEGIGLSLARSLAHSAGALLQVSRVRPRPQLTLLVARAGADVDLTPLAGGPDMPVPEAPAR